MQVGGQSEDAASTPSDDDIDALMNEILSGASNPERADEAQEKTTASTSGEAATAGREAADDNDDDGSVLQKILAEPSRAAERPLLHSHKGEGCVPRIDAGSGVAVDEEEEEASPGSPTCDDLIKGLLSPTLAPAPTATPPTLGADGDGGDEGNTRGKDMERRSVCEASSTAETWVSQPVSEASAPFAAPDALQQPQEQQQKQQPSVTHGSCKEEAGKDEDEVLLERILNEGPEASRRCAAAAVGLTKEQSADAYAEAALRQLLGEESLTAAPDASDGTPAATTAGAGGGAKESSAAPLAKGPLALSLARKQVSSSEFSLEEECDVLQAILGAMQSDVAGGDASSAEGMEADVLAVLDHAERLASCGGGGGTQRGLSVLHTVESHALRDEIKRAKASAGEPLCVDVHSAVARGARGIAAAPSSAPVVAMGTTLGLVLVFNSKNKLCGVCGSVAIGVDSKGSVTSVNFSPDGTQVLAGYERGAVVLWECASLQPLKVVEEFQMPVFKVSFMVPDPMKAFAVDGDGNIKLFSFATVLSKYVFRTNSVSTAFETPANDVASMSEEIREGYSTGNSTGSGGGGGGDVKELHYLACVCTEQLSIYSVSFGIQNDINLIHTSHRAPLIAKSNELVLWLPRTKPTLCVCWTIEAELFSVFHTPDGISVVKLHVIKLPAPVHAISNLEGCCVAMLDQTDTLHVVDTDMLAIVESLPLVGFEPAVYSSRSCGMKYQGSVASNRSDGVAYVLGQGRLLACRVLSWQTRLDTLVTLKLWDAAFDLAKGIARNEALAVVGLSEDPLTRRQQVHDFITQMVIGYVSAKMEAKPESSEMKALVKHIISYCASIGALDIAYGPLLTFFNRFGALDVAIYCFEDALISGTVKALPEHVITMFVDLFSDPARFEAVNDVEDSELLSMQRAETALMFTDENPDVLLALAAEHNLKRLACVVLSLHLCKADAPILTCLGTHNGIALEYLDKLAHGLSLIPNVPIPQGNRKLFKESAVELLIRHETALRDLLRFNIDEVLRIADIFLCEPNNDAWLWRSDRISKLQLLQKLEGLIIVTKHPATKPWEAEKRSWPPYRAVIHFYRIMGHQVAREGVRLAPELLADLAHRMTWHFSNQFSKDEAENQRVELQESLSELLCAPAMQAASVPMGKIERELAAKHMARTLAAIYAARDDHSSALAWYLDHESALLDPNLRRDVFRYITNTIEQMGESPRVQTLRRAVKQHLEILVEVDATALAQFVFEYLPDDHGEVLHSLEGSSTTFFLYLKETVINGGAAVANDTQLQTTYIRLLCMHEPENVYRHLVRHDANITYDLDLALQCCREAGIVDASIFLLEKTLQIPEAMMLLMSSITSSLHRLRENVLQRASEAMLGASVAADISNFSFGEVSFVGGVGNNKNNAAAAAAGGGDGGGGGGGGGGANFSIVPSDDSDAAVLKMVDVGIDLCIRYQHKLDVREISMIWFSLLDRFAKPKRLLFDQQLRSRELRMIRTGQAAYSDDGCVDEPHDELELAGASTIPILPQPLSQRLTLFVSEMQEIYTKYVSYILSRMVKALDLSVVVGKIVDDNEREKFGPFKPIIVDILASLSFDLEVNRLCKLCTDNDTFRLGNQLRQTLCRGLVPRSDTCAQCQKHLSEQVSEFDSLRFYPCGHGYHESCCRGMQECAQCVSDNARGRTTANPNQSLNSRSTAGGLREDGSHRSKKATAVAPARDVKQIMRRLHHTKSKLDGGFNYHEMLHQYMREDGDLSANINKRLALKGLLLSPAPPVPVAVGVPRAAALPTNTDISDGLTEDEVREIFGDTGVFIAPPPRTRRKNKAKAGAGKQQKGGAGGGGGSAGGAQLLSEDDIDLDALSDDFDMIASAAFD